MVFFTICMHLLVPQVILAIPLKQTHIVEIITKLMEVMPIKIMVVLIMEEVATRLMEM